MTKIVLNCVELFKKIQYGLNKLIYFVKIMNKNKNMNIHLIPNEFNVSSFLIYADLSHIITLQELSEMCLATEALSVSNRGPYHKSFVRNRGLLKSI